MKLFNTMTRTKEDFTPRDGTEARVYSCGPTVYNYAHIGNLRTYIFMDELRRALRLAGFSLLHVMNITDVGHLVSDSDEGEDKILKSARERDRTPWEIAREYTEVFMRDIAALNIESPEFIPKATDHIDEMIAFVKDLIEAGFGYEISDGIYFDISRFPGYGKLSRTNLDEQFSGARVEVNAEKRHPADFALWKKATPEHIMQWPSPWGMGYPGWHIECSAMSRKYLGGRFDIHTGGVDHIPIHHENEIAQSEGLLGYPPADVWVHGEFMLVNGGKMSKSLGNMFTLSDLSEKGCSPMDFRYFCLGAHYRSKLNFTWESLKAAKAGYAHLLDALESHRDASAYVDPALLSEYQAKFVNAIEDDLNFPKALGVLWNLLRLPEKSDEIYKLALTFDQTLALNLHERPEPSAQEELDDETLSMIEARTQAKKQKNFSEADRIRGELKARGIILEDTPGGVVWRREL
ncbi:cysteine--tRNA ligase [Clostridia bacterium]|nr:cysteine--tRNA ligase [Clostridia bacterium]